MTPRKRTTVKKTKPTPKNKAKKKANSKPVKAVASNSWLFGARLGGGSYKHGTIEFKLRALPAYVHAHILGKCFQKKKTTRDEYQKFFIETARYGITDILDNGKPVKYGKVHESFGGYDFEGLDDKHLFSIPGNVLANIQAEVMKLSSLSDPEKESVDFTTASESQA